MFDVPQAVIFKMKTGESRWGADPSRDQVPDGTICRDSRDDVVRDTTCTSSCQTPDATLGGGGGTKEGGQP